VNALKNLQNFTANRKLNAAIFQYIAGQLITPEEEFQIREIFEVLDSNGDGIITKEELEKGIDVFRKKFGLMGDLGDIDDIIARIDIDGSGTIDFKEFLTATMNSKRLVQGDLLKQAFDLFDIVRNGHIYVVV
jgi:calcium-dependent protein kinase